jgi:hypothetical protein
MTSYIPIVIIGAGRSGTNILRDTLCNHRGFETWPCDEINYVWRHGNRTWPNDQLPPELASEPVKEFIRGAFDKMATRTLARFAVEKTCANSLRVPFVDSVLPDAKFIVIIRDGRDVVASAMQRWTAPLNLPYIARKARFVPVSDVPYYAARYAAARIHRARSAEKRLGFWGPRFEGFREYVRDHSLAEVCAMQWKRSVELSTTALAALPADRVLEIRYEEFASDPSATLTRVSIFLDLPPDHVWTNIPSVHTSSIGNWQKQLSPEDYQSIEPIARPLCTTLGYEWSNPPIANGPPETTDTPT